MKGMVIRFIASAILFSSTPVSACEKCRPLVNAGVYNQDFTGNLSVLLLPIAVLLAIGLIIYFSDTIKAKLRKDRNAEPWQTTYNAAR